MSAKGRLFRGWMLLTLLSLLAGAPFAEREPTLAASQPAAIPKVASNLGLLLTWHRNGMAAAPDSELARELAKIAETGQVQVSVRFTRVLSFAERRQLEALGVVFERVAGELAHLDRFYGLHVPIDAMERLAAYPLVEWIEAVWQPVTLSPLDLSVTYNAAASTYVDAPAMWQTLSPAGGVNMTGHGAAIANFDTGVDVFHPAFLSGAYGVGYNTWDTDGDGVFTPNSDQLGGVTLRYWNAVGDPNNTAGVDITQDWIFGDVNNNWGYELTEPLYVGYDANGDGVLQAAEYLINRGNLGPGIPNSTIAAVMDSTGVVRVRGVDLELTAPDTNGHGTSVSGILGAGMAHWNTTYVWPLARRYTGMAPDADLLVADRYANAYTAYMPWAQANGAQVMLYEYGAWVQTYLDGSSNHEQMMDVASQQGILQVTPTGNLHCAGTSGCNPRHIQYTLPMGAFPHLMNVPGSPAMTDVWISVLWLTPGNNLTFQVTTPTGGAGNTVALPCVTPGSGWNYLPTVDGHNIGCERAWDSARGTALYNIHIQSFGPSVLPGNWTITPNNPGALPEATNFYVADSSNTWAFGAGWLNAGGGIEKHTATWPSTCDSCLGVASYATRANFIGIAGALSWFSGRGPRFFDNARIVDVAAPGHYDIITPQSSAVSGALGSYNGTFGGTSAAAPHVAGLAALLYQAAGGATDAFHVGGAITRGAWTDGFTGAVPNDAWGFGKLNSFFALLSMMHDLGDAPDSANSGGWVMDAYPGVQANFPTIFNSPTPGPLHWASGSLAFGPWDCQLGVPGVTSGVSAEIEADAWFDEDGVANIKPASNTSDRDGEDAGLAFPGPVAPCAPLPLMVAALYNIPQLPPPRFVNVWIDGNADGDWADIHTCAVPSDAPEWAVQDFALALPGGVLPFAPLVYQANAGDPFWIRVSIAEQPAAIDPVTLRADGRGPAGGYLYGETEDYLYPQTNFTVTPPPACSRSVGFLHDPGSSWPVSFDWNFGDGSTVTDPGPNPGHLYANDGTYTITLTATHASAVFSVYTQQVTVQAAPAVSFTHDSPVCLGSRLHFTDTTSGVASRAWNFGGAGSRGGTSQQPTYLYSAAGTYTVTLTVTDTQGCSASLSRPVTVYGLPAPSFASDSPVCVGQTLHFTDTTPGAVAWGWNFGGAGTQGGAAHQPTFLYTNAGTYTVTERVTDTHGCAASTAQAVMVGAFPTAAFSASTTRPYVHETLTFTNLSQLASSYLWDFGDGAGTSTAVHPTYAYAMTGTFTVTLQATTPCGCSDAATATIEVLATKKVYLPIVLRN